MCGGNTGLSFPRVCVMSVKQMEDGGRVDVLIYHLSNLEFD